MNKREYLNRLGELLACLPKADIEEARSFYEEAIDDRVADGMSEEEAIAAIGTPGAAAEAILDALPAVPRVVAKTRRRSSALLWALVILGSPLWFSLLIAFAAVVLGVYICIWAMVFCLWVIPAACVVSLPLVLVFMKWGLEVGHLSFVVAYLGVGLVLVGASILLFMVASKMSRQLVGLPGAWLRKAWSLFRRERERGGLTDGGAWPLAV